MTREQYLKKLEKIMDAVIKVAEEAKEPRDYIEIIKLELDIVNKIYETTKEEEK